MHVNICRIPEWLAAPSKYKQHWIRYSFIGLAAFWVARFLYLYALLLTMLQPIVAIPPPFSSLSASPSSNKAVQIGFTVPYAAKPLGDERGALACRQFMASHAACLCMGWSS